jgi:hypothetical protein
VGKLKFVEFAKILPAKDLLNFVEVHCDFYNNSGIPRKVRFPLGSFLKQQPFLIFDLLLKLFIKNKLQNKVYSRKK